MQRFPFIVAMLVAVFAPSVHAEKPVEEKKEDKKVVRIVLHQDQAPDRKIHFYMWIHHPDVIVKNTVPDIKVGYNFDSGSLYLTTGDKKDAKPLSAMFFVRNFDGKDYPSHVIVEFGGSRPNDINIRLPEGYMASVQVNNITWDEKEWQQVLEDEAEWKRVLEDEAEAEKKKKE